MPYCSEKLRWRGDFFRANGRWPSTEEMHSAFDGSVPETSSDVPETVPEDCPDEQQGTSPPTIDPGSGERSPASPRARWNVWTGFL